MSPPRRDQAQSDAQRATLLEAAARVIRRDGAAALTMRALAEESGCALGLPYKYFADRNELVMQIVHAELVGVERAGEELVARAGTRSVGGNLAWYAEVLLDSPAVALAREVMADHAMSEQLAVHTRHSDAGPDVIVSGFARYLAAEQDAGRVDQEVDTDAVAFLIAGAVHNLIVSGTVYPRPNRRQLRRILGAVADRL